MNKVVVNTEYISPSKVICIGRNYVEHIKELGNDIPEDMVVFIKPNSAIGQSLKSHHQEPLHYEGEICFVYQNGQFTAVGFGIDLTKRALQSTLKEKGLPWERAKAFDGSAIFSSFVAIDEITDSIAVELTINDEIKQQGAVALMMYKPDEILKELQQFMTLQDGDIVMTGTPKGVGVVKSGDRFNGRILRDEKVLVEASFIAD